MATSRIADHVGRVLGGRYRLLAPIGTGGSAHVFLAEDVTLRRRVAVKVLHAALVSDESFLRRFRAEAQAAAALNHPHVMRVYDWGESEDGPFLVLEHLGGGSLRDLLDAGNRLSPSQALLVGLEAARGLDYAHRRGLVHRDVKPANLLFDDEGRLCIADFGIARALAEAAWTEPSGALLGTARYASPEQAKGSSVDGRSDVYSLALVLVEAVTGTVPFTADTTIATLMARTEHGIEPSESLGPLAEPIRRAGALDPVDRVDAAELISLLDEAARELPAPGRLPLAGAAPADASRVAGPDDLTIVGSPRPPATRVFDQHALRDDFSGEPLQVSPAALRQRRRWPKVVLGVLVAMLLLAASAYAVRQATTPSHPVPTLRGMTLAEARAAVADEGFKIKTSQERFEDGTEAGKIIDQDPGTGTLKEGRTISVVISKGPPPVGIPDLTGKTLAEATELLKAAGLTVGDVTREHSEEVAKDVVLDWAPKTGEAPKGSAVALKVSDGKPPRKLSDWKGKTYDEAAARLKEAGLVPQRVDEYSDEIPEVGKVLRTDPGAGKEVAFGSTVKVYVSKGPKTVAVPNLGGMTEDEAKAAIENAGLTVGTRAGKGRVVAQNPSPGTKVERGTPVDFLLSGR